jgi:hypothetical protein
MSVVGVGGGPSCSSHDRGPTDSGAGLSQRSGRRVRLVSLTARLLDAPLLSPTYTRLAVATLAWRVEKQVAWRRPCGCRHWGTRRAGAWAWAGLGSDCGGDRGGGCGCGCWSRSRPGGYRVAWRCPGGAGGQLAAAGLGRGPQYTGRDVGQPPPHSLPQGVKCLQRLLHPLARTRHSAVDVAMVMVPVLVPMGMGVACCRPGGGTTAATAAAATWHGPGGGGCPEGHRAGGTNPRPVLRVVVIDRGVAHGGGCGAGHHGLLGRGE